MVNSDDDMHPFIAMHVLILIIITYIRD